MGELSPFNITEPAVLLRFSVARSAGGRAVRYSLFSLIDLADLALVVPWFWNARPQATIGKWYAAGRVGARSIGLHRHLLQPRPGLFTDHINGDGLDNRRSNLRAVSPSENRLNLSGGPGPLERGWFPPGVPIVQLHSRHRPNDWRWS